MRNIVSLFLVLAISFTLVPRRAEAEVPAKAKAFLTIAGYGAGGGALLGLASMAFGTSSRAVARGASLGLYAGILFGTYVLVSHHQKRYGNYEDSSSPYRNSTDIYGDDYQEDEGGSGEEGSSRGGFFDRIQVMNEADYNYRFTFGSTKTKNYVPPIKMDIIQYNF